MRAGVNSIRNLCETEVDLFGRISGSANPADVGPKLNSSINEVMTLTLASGILHLHLGYAETASSL